MATVEEVREYLQSQYDVTDIADEVYRLAVGESAVIVAMVRNEKVGDYVNVYQPLASVSDVDVTDVGRRLHGLLTAGLVVWDDFVCLRASLPIRNIYDADLDAAITQVAIEGALIAEALGDRRG